MENQDTSIDLKTDNDRTQDIARLSALNTALDQSNTALKVANLALRELVSSLQNERSLLLEKVEALSHKVKKAPKRQMKEAGVQVPYPTRYCKHDLAHFPQEILLRIFFFTIPPQYTHCPSITSGPRSPWMVSLSTRCALVLTCKSWYGPASEALYIDIVFRRMGQISAFARTLSSAAVVYGQDPSRFVRRIRMETCLILSSYAETVKKDLALVLRRCTALEAFSFTPHPGFEFYDIPPASPTSPQLFNPRWLWQAANGTPGQMLQERCADSLKELYLPVEAGKVDLNTIHRLLSAGNNITVLQMGCSEPDIPEAAVTRAPIVLPHLQDLELHINSNSSVLQAYVSTSWTLPVLRQLTLVGCLEFPKDLLERHGARLDHLNIYTSIALSSSWQETHYYSDFDLLSRTCPVLTHLVLPVLPLSNPQCVLELPSLRYLDLWDGRQKQQVVALMTEMGRVCGLPVLRRLRILPAWCIRYLPPRLPLLCDPEDVNEDEIRVYNFPGMRIIQTSWALLPDNTPAYTDYFGSELWDESSNSDVSWNGELGDDSVSKGDGGYAEEEDDDRTSWISESGSDGLPTDSEGSVKDERDERYDGEALLERFAGSQLEDFLFDDD